MKAAPSGPAARLELVSSPLEAEIRASLLRTAAEQVRLSFADSTNLVDSAPLTTLVMVLCSMLSTQLMSMTVPLLRQLCPLLPRMGRVAISDVRTL